MSGYNWQDATEKLNKVLRLHATPIGIKGYESLDDANHIPKLRRPKHLHTPCQILAQAIQNGFTIGFTAEDIVTENCQATVGLIEQKEEWRSGKIFEGNWLETAHDAASHHGFLTSNQDNFYRCIVASPLHKGVIDPEVCLLTGSPGQIFMLLTGFVRKNFKPLQFTFAGESTCSMTWVRTLQNGQIGLSLPCFGEIRFGGFSEHEVVLALKPQDLIKAIEGLQELHKVGLRYPIPSYGIQMDACEGLAHLMK